MHCTRAEDEPSSRAHRLHGQLRPLSARLLHIRPEGGVLEPRRPYLLAKTFRLRVRGG